MLPTFTFIKSSVHWQGLPEARHEVACLGRSNAGKSSFINAIARQKVARSSKTPGRTQCLNSYALSDDLHLVDCPGYGYSRCSARQGEQMLQLIEQYLTHRTALKGVILLMDCRRPLQRTDLEYLHLFADKRILVVLTKADKISRSQLKQTEKSVIESLQAYAIEPEAVIGSSVLKPPTAELTATVADFIQRLS